jgi:parvulin-like peptidyl-prolyl isomerase
MVLALAAASAAGARAAVVEDVVARVNGHTLLLSEYRKNLKAALEGFQKNMPGVLKENGAVDEIRKKVVDQMVDDELLAQEAEKQKIRIYQRELEKGVEEVSERSFRDDEAKGRKRTDAEMQAALAEALKKEGLSEEQFRERIRRQLLMRKVIEEQVRSKLKEPEDKRAQDAFERLKKTVAEDPAVLKGALPEALKGLPEEEAQAYAGFAQELRNAHAERVRVEHILLKVPAGAPLIEKNKVMARAQALRKRLDGGEDFEELAQKESEDVESAPRGGDLGTILKGWMPPEFEKAAFSMNVGEVSQPVETNFGFHILRVQEKKAAETMRFEKLKPSIKQFLMNIDFQKELQVYIKKLRTSSTVEVKLPAE